MRNINSSNSTKKILMYVNVNVLQVSSCNFSPPRIYFLFTTELGREHLLDKQAGNLKSVHGHMHMIVLIGERVTYLCISDFLSLINYKIPRILH